MKVTDVSLTTTIRFINENIKLVAYGSFCWSAKGDGSKMKQKKTISVNATGFRPRERRLTS